MLGGVGSVSQNSGSFYGPGSSVMESGISNMQTNSALDEPLDFSSGAFQTSPVGGTWRGILSSWFNAENVAKEDWLRSEQSAYNAYLREAIEAQKNRDFQERMSNTAYQRAIADMKKAGINPVLAYSQGGADTPSGDSASARSSYSPSVSSDPFGSVLKVIAGLVTTVVTKNPKAGVAAVQTVDKFDGDGNLRSRSIRY